MNKRALLYLALTTTLLAALLFIVAIDAPTPQNASKRRLDYNHILGSAIEYKEMPFTLNFEQQNALITYLNEAEPSHQFNSDSFSPPYSKLIFYLFNASDIHITPLAYINGNLLFSTPLWNEGNPLLEKSNGFLKDMLEKSYDH